MSNNRGFPERRKTEKTIVEILKEHGGTVRIQNVENGRTIYEEVARRLDVPDRAIRRKTSTGESAWRPEVGFAKKNLVERGIIKTPDESGRGIWSLR